MQRLCTDDMYDQWERKCEESICTHLAHISNPDLPSHKLDYNLGMLASCYRDEGIINIAKGNTQKALEVFAKSVDIKCQMYERHRLGKGRALEAGEFQALLLALATNDDKRISTLAEYYQPINGVPGSIFLGAVLKHLATNNIEAAYEVVLQKPPRIDPQFNGYRECLAALSQRDEKGFLAALQFASQSWAKWVSKYAKEESVCFVDGIGLVRLAYRVLGHPFAVVDENIRQDLLA